MTNGPRAQARQNARRNKILGILGELFITFGVIVLLYVGWQIFISDSLVSQTQQQQSEQVAPQNQNQTQVLPFAQIRSGLKPATVFAKVFVPRFGKRYERLIGEGTRVKTTLDTVGVGHYSSSSWPGEVGNFAIAAHRMSHGAPFADIDKLRAGDKVWVETNDSWYTYEYRQTLVVEPTDVSVISSVPPEFAIAVAGGRYMTMTSCHPKWTNRQRIVVWLELTASQPRLAGMPESLTDAQKYTP